jgi:hypothetical protein
MGWQLPFIPCLPQPKQAEGKQLRSSAGRFMALLEEAWLGPVRSGMALKAGTINPAHYFLRASHPINNSFGW